MKAIGYSDAGPISAENALFEFETDRPQPGPHDLLVAVHGISVNPVDVKGRQKLNFNLSMSALSGENHHHSVSRKLRECRSPQSRPGRSCSITSISTREEEND